MNQREQDIFLRGVKLGLETSNQFDNFIIEVDNKIKNVSKLFPKKVHRKIGRKNHRWTEEDKNILYDISLSAPEVAKIIGVSKESVYSKRVQLGIKVTQENIVNNKIAKLNQD